MNGAQDFARQQTRVKRKRNGNKTKNKARVNDTVPTNGEEGKLKGTRQRPSSQAGVNKQKRKRNKKEGGTLLVKESDIKELPAPGPRQDAALTKLLNTICTEYGMSDENLIQRETVFKEVKQLLQQEIPDCPVRMYGSSVSGLGHKTSDVNIDVHEENEEKVPKVFIRFLNVLRNCPEENYSDLKEEFDKKWPVINFTDVKSGLRCSISTGKTSSFLTNCLLKIYNELDSRVKSLCVALKLWAKICRVDCQAAGTLPSYCFILMVVHYLQQTDPPVLPVIHEKLNDVTKYLEEQKSVEDIVSEIREKWTTWNNDSPGSLWIGLLRYYAYRDRNETFVINVRQENMLLRSAKGSWGKKRFAIEDPFATSRNIARTVVKTSVYQYIVEHIKIALLYFGRYPGFVPTGNHETKTGSENIPSVSLPEESGSKNDQSEISVKNDKEVLTVSGDEADIMDESGDDNVKGADDLVDGIFAPDTINDSSFSDPEVGDIEEDHIITDESLVSGTSLSEPNMDLNQSNDHSPVFVMNKQNTSEYINGNVSVSSGEANIDWESAEYVFDDTVLRKGPPLETKCSVCGEEGHIADNCSADTTMPLKKLPQLTNGFKEILTNVCVQCKVDFAITSDESGIRQVCIKALETYIRKDFPDARLHLFGSSCNGFGFQESDIDICMTLQGKAKSEVDCIAMITKLARLLTKNPECAHVIAITGAKVPIVKFFLKRPKLEADISLYNEVALWNTKLLYAYVRIDERVQILGCALKIFVKLCEIGDASRGSLSSYAYILMLLHFLQQRQPPVIPVLQDMYDTKEQPERIVEGFNCWFYDDLKNLCSRWRGENTESCGELWLGFLRYYTEVFDFKHNVVCVRSLKVLTKFEKMWNGKQICIEDPFVLSHNLGKGLSIVMSKFIRSTFVKARERFGMPRRDIPQNVQQRQRYFFDPMFLNDGAVPPTGRNCNICGKIGHWAKECPYNKTNQEQGGKNQRKKSEKDEENKVEPENKKGTGNSENAKRQAKPKQPDPSTCPPSGKAAGAVRSHHNTAQPALSLTNQSQSTRPALDSSHSLNHVLVAAPLPARPPLPVNVTPPTSPLIGGQATLISKVPRSLLSATQLSSDVIDGPPLSPVGCTPQISPMSITPPVSPLNGVQTGSFLTPGQPPFLSQVTKSSPLPFNPALSPMLRPGHCNPLRFASVTRPLAPRFPHASHLQQGGILPVQYPGIPPKLNQRDAVVSLHPNQLTNSRAHLYQPLSSPPGQHPFAMSLQAPFPGLDGGLLGTGASSSNFAKGAISCEDLERMHVYAACRDEPDGTKLGSELRASPSTTVERNLENPLPTAVQNLQHLNISSPTLVDQGCPLGTSRPCQKNVGSKQQHTFNIGDSKASGNHSTGEDAREPAGQFSSPPNVRSVAATALSLNDLASVAGGSSSNQNETSGDTGKQDQGIEHRDSETEKSPPSTGKEVEIAASDVSVEQNGPAAVQSSTADPECTKEPSSVSNSRNRRRRNRRKNKQIQNEEETDKIGEKANVSPREDISRPDEQRSEVEKEKTTSDRKHGNGYVSDSTPKQSRPQTKQQNRLENESQTAPHNKVDKTQSRVQNNVQNKPQDKLRNAPQGDSRVKTQNQSPRSVNSKTDPKTIIVQVNINNERKVVVENSNDPVMVVNDTQSKKRRQRQRRRTRRKKNAGFEENSERGGENISRRTSSGRPGKLKETSAKE